MSKVVVTGARGALGTAVCTTLSNNGWSVVELDKEDVNLLDMAATDATFQAIGSPLHAVVHVVGGIIAGKPLEDTTAAELESMFALNVASTFNVLHSALPLLKQTGGGNVVTIGARDVLHPQPNRAAYAAAKSAVVGLTKSVAEEGREHNIRANVILPSILRTAANLAWGSNEEARTWVDPNDVAMAIAHLIDPSNQISGAVIPMYGGIPY